MDPFTITAFVSLLGLLLSVLAGIAASSEKTAPYAEVLKQIERVISGKPLSTRPLETQLDEAVEQLTKASQRVGDVLGEVQADVEKRRREVANLRSLIEDLKKQYEENKSLASLTADQAQAIRQVFSTEVSVLKRRSYLPDILINFSVGLIFFVLGILVTLMIRR